jgi:hypothetical protein
MTITLDLQNSNNWVVLFSETYTATTSGVYTTPIPEQILPVLAESQVLHVSTGVPNAGRNWHTGGRIIPAFANAIALAQLASYWLPINDSRLIVLPGDFASTYQLKYSAPRWFQSVQLTIFQYTGKVDDSTSDQLNQIVTQLNTIQSQVSAIPL